MTAALPRVLTMVAIAGNALVAGVFFAFSTFVMKGLARVPSPTGIVAMQGINAAAPTPPFMLALFGSALTGAVLTVLAVVEWGSDSFASTYALIGGVASLVPLALRIVVHVPRNEALATLDPHDAAAADRWTTCAAEWTAWNHARTLGALIAVTMFTISLLA